MSTRSETLRAHLLCDLRGCLTGCLVSDVSESVITVRFVGTVQYCRVHKHKTFRVSSPEGMKIPGGCAELVGGCMVHGAYRTACGSTANLALSLSRQTRSSPTDRPLKLPRVRRFFLIFYTRCYSTDSETGPCSRADCSTRVYHIILYGTRHLEVTPWMAAAERHARAPPARRARRARLRGLGLWLGLGLGLGLGFGFGLGLGLGSGRLRAQRDRRGGGSSARVDSLRRAPDQGGR